MKCEVVVDGYNMGVQYPLDLFLEDFIYDDT